MNILQAHTAYIVLGRHSNTSLIVGYMPSIPFEWPPNCPMTSQTGLRVYKQNPPASSPSRHKVGTRVRGICQALLKQQHLDSTLEVSCFKLPIQSSSRYWQSECPIVNPWKRRGMALRGSSSLIFEYCIPSLETPVHPKSMHHKPKTQSQENPVDRYRHRHRRPRRDPSWSVYTRYCPPLA